MYDFLGPNYKSTRRQDNKKIQFRSEKESQIYNSWFHRYSTLKLGKYYDFCRLFYIKYLITL